MSHIKTALKRALLMPERVRDLETRTDLHDDIIEHCGSDIVKLEEAIEAQREFNAQIKWILGSTFEQREIES